MKESDTEVVFTRPSTGAVYTFEKTDTGWQATIVRSRNDGPISEAWTDAQLAQLKAQIAR